MNGWENCDVPAENPLSPSLPPSLLFLIPVSFVLPDPR